jgi:large subunit ribosomal protein L22
VADKVSPAPEGGWESLKVDELKAELEARGLPKSGNKAELVERLLDDDAGQGVSAAAPAAEKEAVPDDAEQITETPEPDSEEAQEASEDAAGAADADEEAAEKQPKQRRRRGSAETSTGTRRQRAPRPEGDLIVRARARYVRSAPRKARLVMNHIRGKRVEHAQAILEHAPRAISSDILKLLNSAIANAESAYELGADELTVHRAYVDEGPTIKRFRPRALGRATKINKRTSHMTIELTAEGNGR